jgi:hypothetical protein
LGCGPGHSLSQQFVFHRLLAKQALKLTHLCFHSAVIGRGDDLLTRRGGGERALGHQPTPGEQLIAGNAVSTGYQRHRVARQVGLFDYLDLLLGRPAQPALHRGGHLHAIIGSSHTVRHMHHTSISARVCQPR